MRSCGKQQLTGICILVNLKTLLTERKSNYINYEFNINEESIHKKILNDCWSFLYSL